MGIDDQHLVAVPDHGGLGEIEDLLNVEVSLFVNRVLGDEHDVRLDPRIPFIKGSVFSTLADWVHLR